MARTLAGEIAKARSEEVSASALSMSTDVQGGSPPTEASQSTEKRKRRTDDPVPANAASASRYNLSTKLRIANMHTASATLTVIPGHRASEEHSELVGSSQDAAKRLKKSCEDEYLYQQDYLVEFEEIKADGGKIPKPATINSGLQRSMGLESQDGRWRRLQQYVNTMCREHLDTRRTYTQQDPQVLKSLHEQMATRHPFLTRFKDNWATNAMLSRTLITLSRTERLKAGRKSSPRKRVKRQLVDTVSHPETEPQDTMEDSTQHSNPDSERSERDQSQTLQGDENTDCGEDTNAGSIDKADMTDMEVDAEEVDADDNRDKSIERSEADPDVRLRPMDETGDDVVNFASVIPKVATEDTKIRVDREDDLIVDLPFIIPSSGDASETPNPSPMVVRVPKGRAASVRLSIPGHVPLTWDIENNEVSNPQNN